MPRGGFLIELRGRVSLVCATLLALVAVVAVVADGHRAVAGISRPYDIDQFRDLAAARSIADGHPLRDPDYRGETIWYSPLLPAVIAFLTRSTHADVATVFVQAGPFLNALPVIALFAMVATFFGPWPGLVAVLSLLFSPPHNNPAWATPTYSPWLFPATLAPAFFYAGLLCCWVAARRNRPGWWVAAGASLGLTFLAHTAAALILGPCCLLAIFVARPAGASDGSRGSVRARAAAILFGTAIVIAAPVLWSIVFRYHMRILNPAPNNWVWAPLRLEYLRDWLRSWVSYGSIPPIVGVAVAVARLRRHVAAKLVLCWAAVTSLLLAYGFVQQAVGFDRLPALVPHYHFYVYFLAVGHVFTGIGVWAIVSSAARILGEGLAGIAPGVAAAASATVVVLLAGAYVGANLPAYHRRPGFHHDRSIATDRALDQAAADVTRRLRSETPADAVVLASQEHSIFDIAPAGRGVVVVPESSPIRSSTMKRARPTGDIWSTRSRMAMRAAFRR
jgi:hypothetical protein